MLCPFRASLRTFCGSPSGSPTGSWPTYAPPPDACRQEKYLVRGCQSQVWLIPRHDPATDRVSLTIDSDAHIVRGLIAIVLAAYDEHTPGEILQFDIDGLFDELELLKHLSPTRGNGLRALIGRVREFAASGG